MKVWKILSKSEESESENRIDSQNLKYLKFQTLVNVKEETSILSVLLKYSFYMLMDNSFTRKLRIRLKR